MSFTGRHRFYCGDLHARHLAVCISARPTAQSREHRSSRQAASFQTCAEVGRGPDLALVDVLDERSAGVYHGRSGRSEIPQVVLFGRLTAPVILPAVSGARPRSI
jgi:hypothetical protein